MPRNDARSLWQRLSAGGGLAGRTLADPTTAVGLADLERRSCLGGARDELRGRSVMLAAKDQLPAALALIELDGIARRIVLAPPDLAPEHFSALLATAEIDAVLTDGALPAPPAHIPVVTISASKFAPAAAPRDAAEHTEWVLLTSGTTGVPKLVVHDVASLAGPERTGAAPEPRMWSTFYDLRRYGGLAIFFRALLGGGSMVLSSAEEATGAFLARVAGHGVTHISGTPSHWRRALMSPAARGFRPRYVRLSGEIADQAILDRLHAFWPEAAVAHAFASTEAGLAFDVNDGRAGFPASLVGGSDGDVRMTVVEGSLRIRSSRTAARYLGQGAEPLADAEGFVDTRDLVEERDGRYYFAGRSDGIVNVGGVKVHPEEVEAIINAHPGVLMSLVEARRSPVTGAVVEASVVSAAGGAGEALARDILEFCRRQLPRHKVPVAIRFVPSLAVGPTGKLVRRDA